MVSLTGWLSNAESTSLEERSKTRDLTPRYRELAEALMSDINDGRLAVGERLPGEIELTQQFEVSRHTVREALRVLEDLGLIKRQRGVGTVVQASQVGPAYVQAVRQPDELMQYPQDSRLHVVETGPVVLKRALARKLGCPAGSHWYRISAVRRLITTGVPLCFVEIYVLPEFAAIAKRLGAESAPVYELLAREFQLEIEKVELTISADLVSRETAPILEVEEGSPTLELVRRYLSRGKPFEVSVSEHPADRFNYSLEFQRGWKSGGGWSWS
jgi:DNA-binding GntR family transcriptional regulator